MEDLVGGLIEPIRPFLELSQRLCTLFLIVLWIALIFWTWRDAKRRGAMPWFWAIVAAMFFVFGWAIYMVVRPPEYADDALERDLEIEARKAELQREAATCPACHKPIEPDYLICPSCMKKLRKECVNCDRALKLDWVVCPYCKTRQ